MLPRLQAERQLRAIEAASVPHMKPEDVSRVMRRHGEQLNPKEQRPRGLHDALMGAGIQVVEVPTPKRSRKRRAKQGRDER